MHMPRYSLALLLFSTLMITSCSRMPTIDSTRSTLTKMKNTVSYATPRLFKRTPPRYPAALPLKRVNTAKPNTCPPPRRPFVSTHRSAPAGQRRQQIIPVSVQTAAVAIRSAQPPRPLTSPRSNPPAPYGVPYTPPAPQQLPTLNPQQANQQLFNTAKSGNADQINRLIRQGAQVNAANSSGETALHAAASAGNTATAQALLQQGANINAQTINGWTPLHTAARFGRANVASLLLTRGAQRNALNSDGKTPLQLARQANQGSTISMLQR